MTLVRSALIATAACLIGAAAYAQPATGDTSPPAGDQSTQQAPQTPPTGNPPGPMGSSDMNAGASTSAPAGSTDMSQPSTGAAPTGAASNTSATVTTDANGTQVIASQPVPDTPVNLDGSDAADLKVNSADIIQADIRTSNGGVIHVIGKVLIPSDSPYAAQLAPAPAPAATTP